MPPTSLSAGLFRFDLTVTDEIVLPPYKGFAFRGVFGTVLKELACVIPGEACPRCPFRHTCTYAYLFETSPADGVDGFRRFSNFPRPYIIRPPGGDQRQFRRYDSMSFEFILVGHSSEYIPLIILAFEEIGKRGIRNGHGKFIIDTISAKADGVTDQIIYTKGKMHSQSVPLRSVSLHTAETTEVTSVKLIFHTPLLLEKGDKIIRNPPSFDFLFEYIARRISLLQKFNGLPEIDAYRMKTLMELAKSIGISKSFLRWNAMERFSNRQQARIKTGGLIGSISYAGDLTPFIPYLRAGELLHVGKSTTWGFGGYKLRLTSLQESQCPTEI